VYLPLSFLLYVGLHFGQPAIGAGFVPDWLPFPLFWNYFTGLCILAFIVSTLWGKYDKLATLLKALYVLLMIFLVHMPRAADSENDMLNIFRNIMVIGALLVYAKHVAKDKRLTE
jgi:glycerol-3-phosphate acyltransferase PlsY